MKNQQQFLESALASCMKDSAALPALKVGDTVNIHVRIIEGEKERIQVYQGVLIAQKGRGVNTTITVRRIVANEGVERIFPLHSPRISLIEVVRHADTRRAKLYYLRDRSGKSRRLRDQRRGLKHVEPDAPAADSAVGETAAASA